MWLKTDQLQVKLSRLESPTGTLETQIHNHTVSAVTI